MNNKKFAVKFILAVVSAFALFMPVLSSATESADDKGDSKVINNKSDENGDNNSTNSTSGINSTIDNNHNKTNSTDTSVNKANSTENNTKANTTEGNDNETNNTLVKGPLTRSNKFKYIVMINAGRMWFEYSYGPTWDPISHTYCGNSEGWNIKLLEEAESVEREPNNRIEIVNLSEFPIKANFEYEDEGFFGEAPEGKYNVGGIFMRNKDELKALVEANNINPSTSLYATASMTLESDTSTLSSGTTYYYKNYDDVEGENMGYMYFSLIGTPAKELQNNTYTKVGVITITITPEIDVHVAVK